MTQLEHLITPKSAIHLPVQALFRLRTHLVFIHGLRTTARCAPV